MPRNRQQTEDRIREAARRLLREGGFEAWGVNGIARAAGVDKVLIYRYFTSVDGLLTDIIHGTPFWPDPESLPDESAETFLNATLEALQAWPEGPCLLAHPSARSPVSAIRRKAADDLQHWMDGFRARTRGSAPEDALARLPALLFFQAATGDNSLSPRDLWEQVSPPLEWGVQQVWSANDELPTELL
jgi:AcrR family transcriptional regulator